jgi:rRNA maturation protein Nop10
MVINKTPGLHPLPFLMRLSLVLGGMTLLEYGEWIARERRLRIRLLMQSPDIQRSGLFRVCQQCREICLCHEEVCPNCGGDYIDEQPEDRDQVARGERIRCHLRFQQLAFLPES